MNFIKLINYLKKRIEIVEKMIMPGKDGIHFIISFLARQKNSRRKNEIKINS